MQSPKQPASNVKQAIMWVLLCLILCTVAFIVLLDREFSAKNLEKYHCVNENIMRSNPEDKSPAFYGYHITLGGDKRGFIAHKERSFRITSAEYAEELWERTSLRPMWYDNNTCSRKTGVAYHFTHHFLTAPKLKVVLSSEDDGQVKEKSYECREYGDIHYHRYLDLQKEYREFVERQSTDRTGSCSQ